MSSKGATHRPLETIKQSGPVDTSIPYNVDNVAGKTILITGGASGFGAGFARKWAANGANIIIGDINQSAGEELVADLRRLPAPATRHHHFRPCDVTRWSDMYRLFHWAVHISPTAGLDAVVASAGICEPQHAMTGTGLENPHGLDVNPDDVTTIPPAPPLRTLAVNLTGVMYTAHLALFWLPRNGNGGQAPLPPHSSSPPPAATTTITRDRHLLLIGSVAGLIPLVGHPEYTAAKHAVTGLFRSLRATAWRHGVRANLICPYFVDTPVLPSGALYLLAGAALGTIDDVIDAGSRLMADQTIVGRALAVGPPVRNPEGEPDHTMSTSSDDKRAVWECYAHDFDVVEPFTHRYVRLLNFETMIRGWIGCLMDQNWVFFWCFVVVFVGIE